MNLRIWDPEKKYIGATIKIYPHWVVEVSFSQHTLGCCIIFARRKILKITECSNEELLALRDVMEELEATLTKLFSPIRFNYFQMGNALHHLHFHVVPRYVTVKEYAGKYWKDPTPTHLPCWSAQEEERELIYHLKETIKKEYTISKQ